jgi:AraC-like DNA-binding protein
MKQDLLYREVPVPPELAASVLGIWRLQGHCEDALPHVVLPDGCLSLMLNFGAPLAPAPSSAAVERGHGLLGEIRRPLRVMARGTVDLVGVRLVPGASLALTRVPLAELVDGVAGEAVLTSMLGRLLRTLESAAPGDRIPLLLAGLQAVSRRPESKRTAHAALHAAVASIYRAQGNVRVDALAASLGASRRTLERLFRQQLGFSPKSLCDVLRFQSAVRIAQVSGAGNWADIACAAGYFDQSHLIRDYRRFAGATPTGLEG